MAMGVTVANAILLVTFAERERQENGGNALDAAVEGGRTRLRPILMTGLRHDCGHDSHGPGHRRRRRSDGPAGTRGYRRANRGDRGNPIPVAGGLRHDPTARREPNRPHSIRMIRRAPVLIAPIARKPRSRVLACLPIATRNGGFNFSVEEAESAVDSAKIPGKITT